MARQLLEHVIEKTDAGGNIINARPIEVEIHLDRRFMCRSPDRALAHEARYSDPLPVRNVLTAKRQAFTTWL